MWQYILEYLLDWTSNLKDSLKTDTVRKILIILISPFMIYVFAQALIDFGWFATVGYIITCLHGFSKIVDDPYRIIKWGVGYAIGALVTPLIFTSVWPSFSEGTAVSIFSGMMILYVLFMVWWRARELKMS